MKNKWQLSIKLTTETLLSIEKDFNIVLPNNLKEFLLKNNASTPSEKYFDTLTSKEEMLNNIIDFNYESIESFEKIYIRLKKVLPSDTIPFAKDSFGNYICMNTSDEKIVFYEHENQQTVYVADNLEEFINHLYGALK